MILDRNSKEYLKLIDKLMKLQHKNLRIKEVTPYFYITSNNEINIELKEIYLDKLEERIKNFNNSSKGFFYQDFVLKFLQQQGIKILERKKTGDGGLDVIGYIDVKIINGIESKVNIYGQIKCFSDIVRECELKQLIKDKMYEIINNKNSFNECSQGIFISHKGFNNSAKKYAIANNIILLDSDDIIIEIMNEKKNLIHYCFEENK